MKKLLLLSFCLIAISAGSQTIKDLQAYYKLSGSRIATLLSDNTVWWWADEKGWQQVPGKGLENKTLVSLSAYVGFGDTRVSVLASDNTIYTYSESKSTWEPVAHKGLAPNAELKIFNAYYKPSAVGWTGESRFFVAENNNKMWWLNDDEWKSVPADGLPKDYDLKFVRTYQKYGMMGGAETRYVGVMKNNTLWWTAGKKWQQVEATGLPANTDIKLFEAYMKYAVMGNHEGRLVAVLSDNSFWFIPAQSKKWSKVSSQGLPAVYNVKLLKVFQKYGLGEEARLVVALDDNTLWWYTEGKNWTKINTAGLKLGK